MLNGSEFATIAAAIAALPLEGGAIYLPSRQDSAGNVIPYIVSSPIVVDRAVRFFGDGPAATQIVAGTTNPKYTLFDVRSGFVQFDNLRISGRASAADTFDCIKISGLGITGELAQHCVLRNCEVDSAGRNALRLLDVIIFEADNCSFIHSQSDGVYIDTGPSLALSATTTLRFMNCSMSYNKERGAYLPRNAVGATFFGCVFEGNQGGAGPNDGAALSAHSAYRMEMYSCYFEVPDTVGADPEQYLYFASSPGVIVDGCVFTGDADTTLFRSAKFANCGWARFSNNVASMDYLEIVMFDSECDGAIEFGNRDLNVDSVATPRIRIEGRGVTAFSSGTTNVGRFYKDNLPPAGTQPGKALPGSIAWIENAAPDSGQSQLQVSNGSAWKSIHLGSSRRRIFLPAITMRSRAGTNTISDQGTYPNRYSFVSWSGSAAGTNGVGIETIVPDDYNTADTDSVRFTLVWSYDTLTSGQNWVCEIDYLSRANNASMTSTGTTITREIDTDRGAVNSVFYDEVVPGASGIAPGNVLRFNVARRAQDGADNYSGAIRLIGVVIEYSVL